PVREFFESVDERVQDSLVASLEILRRRNVQARAPLVRHLDGKLGELRDEVRTNIFRVINFFSHERRIILLHAFQKKTQ
ncbi:MAG: type II toxin-antitoxin system RelE/ParE family toxin, partial [Chloroflexota bacterium]